jgi:catechol 2,3-dioxygenase-like lactoylglutathione lyase family enzyme
MEKIRPVLDQVNVVVRDVERAAAFYARLGVEFRDSGPVWNAHHRNSASDSGAHVELDSASFATRWNPGWTEGSTGPVLGFKVATREDVDRLYIDLTGAGYKGQHPPHDAFWGARYAIVEDPDGNSVGLMSPSEPARRVRPPAPPAK